MNTQELQNLIASPVVEVSENFVEFIAKISVQYPYDDLCNKWIEFVSNIPTRDFFELFFCISGDRCSLDRSEESLRQVRQFLSEFADEGELEIKLHVRKNVVDGVVSVYSLEKFASYVANCELKSFLSNISSIFSGWLCFEVFNEIKDFGSETIVFRPHDSSCDLRLDAVGVADDNRKARLDLFKDNCLAANYLSVANGLLPSDFRLKSDGPSDVINDIFKAACATLSLMFLANSSEYGAKNSFSFKFYGYKAVIGEGSVFDCHLNDCGVLNDIYCWVYAGGNSSDKLGLVRNLISVHLDAGGRPRFDKQLSDAIWSNYQIYLKGNIQSYLEVKNKIGELLVDFIGRVSEIADDLLDSLKSNVAIVVTFLLTVVVVNGLKDNGEAVIFSNIYLGVVVIITVVSALWLYFLKGNIIERFNSAADSIKQTILANYGQVLLPEEISGSIDPSVEANRGSLLKEVSSYSRLWKIILIVFLVLYVIGNFIFVENSFLSLLAELVVHLANWMGEYVAPNKL